MKIVIETITIIAFLVAYQYITTKPSIAFIFHNNNPVYNLNNTLIFYNENNIKIPDTLSECNKVNNFFKKVREFDYNKIIDFNVDSDVSLIKAINIGNSIPDEVLNMRIKNVEAYLDDITYKKRIYSFSEYHFYSLADIKNIGEEIRSKISLLDYYYFICAIIHSREINNDIYIKNNGDIDLINLHFTIPSPRSKITESIQDNIKEYDILSDIVASVNESNLYLKIELPSLKKGDTFGMNIVTRENAIDTTNIIYTYQKDEIINYDKPSYLILLAIFLIVTILNTLNKKSLSPDK